MDMEHLVLAAARASLVAAAAWGALVVTAGLYERIRGVAPRVLRAVTPSLARRCVAVLCGAAVGSATVGAPAAGATGHDRGDVVAGHVAGAELRDTLAGLPLPDRAAGGPAGREERPMGGPAGARSRAVVEPGDSLWSLAEQRLPTAVGARRVDRAWRAIYAANRERIGGDPDLLIPGTILRLPPGLGQERHPDTRTRGASDPRKDRP